MNTLAVTIDSGSVTRAKADPQSHPMAEALVRSNLDLARHVARRYSGRGIELDDLCQVAAVGLIKAARRYDPTRGTAFAGYAVPTIRGELRRHFRDEGWWVRPPRHIQEAGPVIAQTEERLRQRLMREPTDAEIAAEAELGVSAVRQSHAARTCFSPLSIEAPTAQPGGSRGAALVAPDSPLAQAEARVVLEAALCEFSAQDRDVLRMRFVEDLTQAQIGQRLGVTQIQVSRTLTKILARMRDRLTEPLGQTRPGPTVNTEEVAMPESTWSAKRERQYKHIKSGLMERGEETDTAEEIAARTVNKERARHGESKTASRTSTEDMSSSRRGGQRSHSGRGGRTKEQLYAEARKKNIRGRSTMTKAQLEKAVGR